MFKYIPGMNGSYTAHSLSWHRDKDPNPNGIMIAKVWTPEDPRTKGGQTSSSAYTNLQE